MPFQIPAMNEERAPSKEHARVFHQLLEAIEAVRLTRQEDYREKRHPQLKRFTQLELNDEACPTYKNWLIGRSNRLPSRSMLMTIADYLECSLGERNDLLLAAQYLPEQPAWEGDALRRALEQAQQIMETLPYPAIVVTHTCQVQAANEFFLRLLELPPLETLPPHQRSMMHFLFHPDFRRHSMINAEAHALWQKHALYAVQRFKQQNVLSQYDAWYQQSIQQWCDDIACFQEYWEKAREVTRQEVAPTKMVFARMATTGEVLPIRVRHMLVSVSSKIYPAVSALLPVDEAARAVYASLGSVTSWPSSVG
jgi:MmyB-like transcription regulator ligand binding domain